jgi:hypothetical protein
MNRQTLRYWVNPNKKFYWPNLITMYLGGRTIWYLLVCIFTGLLIPEAYMYTSHSVFIL